MPTVLAYWERKAKGKIHAECFENREFPSQGSGALSYKTK